MYGQGGDEWQHAVMVRHPHPQVEGVGMSPSRRRLHVAQRRHEGLRVEPDPAGGGAAQGVGAVGGGDAHRPAQQRHPQAAVAVQGLRRAADAEPRPEVDAVEDRSGDRREGGGAGEGLERGRQGGGRGGRQRHLPAELDGRRTQAGAVAQRAGDRERRMARVTGLQQVTVGLEQSSIIIDD